MESQVTVLTAFHSITGNLMLRDQRLSDLLNDRRDSVIHLFEAVFAPLTNPDEKNEKQTSALVRKDDIVVAFEQSDQLQPMPKRLYSFVRKQRHDICLLMDGIQVRGVFHTPGGLDIVAIHRLITTGNDMFLPITRVVIKIGVWTVEQEAAIVNSRRISYIALVKPVQETASTGAG